MFFRAVSHIVLSGSFRNAPACAAKSMLRSTGFAARQSFSTLVDRSTLLENLTHRITAVGTALNRNPSEISDAVESVARSTVFTSNPQQVVLQEHVDVDELTKMLKLTKPSGKLLRFALSAGELSVVFPDDPALIATTTTTTTTVSSSADGAHVTSTDPKIDIRAFLANTRVAESLDLLSNLPPPTLRRLLHVTDPEFVTKLAVNELQHIFRVRPHRLRHVFRWVMLAVPLEDSARHALYARFLSECRSIGFSESNIRSLIERTPTVLAYKSGRLSEQFRFLTSQMGYSDTRARSLLSNIPWTLVISSRHVAETRSYLRSRGMGDSEIERLCKSIFVVRANPERTIGPRFDWFVNQCGYSMDYLAAHHFVFSYSLQDRVVPRMLMWQSFIVDQKKGGATKKHDACGDDGESSEGYLTIGEYEVTLRERKDEPDTKRDDVMEKEVRDKGLMPLTYVTIPDDRFAKRMGVDVPTVRKWVERCKRELGVRAESAAVVGEKKKKEWEKEQLEWLEKQHEH
ncbi:mitochondrial transcription termination factor (mTERF) domain-containing protein [Andalucia godoyi]|uniref:Mitochondrial transcription termination factor (mTERF) domain-containing protein n=1 Tax=Andalucia godoyi TaxID=505711 RepID=A0A8K0F4D5_ANDGO|nr:mitochondrial transcription termination factor (mTERF) domain-containing protein [Andalucia godoyi]|eukprot:ANDGO_00955.mRNA.1 mitochondrial transcription termination factor (mTERF) domain-containing protein